MDDVNRTSLWSDFVALHRATDAESGLLRAAHLQALVRLTPATMAANLCSAGVVLWTFSPRISTGMWIWALVLALTAALALRHWYVGRHRVRSAASPRAMHHAAAQAAWLAGVWGVMPVLWFPAAGPEQQMVIATLVTGMIGAGSFVLATVPLAATAYVAVFSLASLWALYRAGNPAPGVAALVGVYSPMVWAGAISAWAKSTALLREQTLSARQEQTLTLLLQDFEQGANEALWETGADGQLTHMPDRLMAMLGTDAGHAGAMRLLDLLHQLSPLDAPTLRAAVRTGKPFRELGFRVEGANGATRHLVVNGKPLFNASGAVTGWRGVLADNTDKVLAEQQLRQLAHTDSLTGLANRFRLRDVLGQSLKQDSACALLLLDLDHFKAVNDTLGHSAGDDVLQAVAEVLRGCVRPSDLVARLGGDEFAVVMQLNTQTTAGLERAEVSAMAARLIDALGHPVLIPKRQLRVGASIGVAVHEGSDSSVDELLAQADTALYAAKEAGRARFAMYEPSLGERNHRRLTIEEGLREALTQHQLALHWQAKVDIHGWRIVGAEALLRFTHPELGPISPAEFIPVAEQCGLIDDIGRWALEEACRAAAGPLQGLTVAVNVSPLQMRDGQFVSYVRQALRTTGLASSKLELEITESVLIDNEDAATDQLRALHGLGVRIALDDFGTGYSSLAYLRQFPFDTLKIDRAFVHEVATKTDARAIVQMISELAAALSMRTVCEGVETAQQLQAVSHAGCHEVQGYLVGRPMPLAEFGLALQQWHEQPPRMPLAALH